jgi:dienelactone hydrolase
MAARFCFGLLVGMLGTAWAWGAQPLPGTRELTGTNDLAAAMVEGIGRYLDRETVERARIRATRALPTESGVDARRVRLHDLLGLVDARGPVALRTVHPVQSSGSLNPAPLAEGAGFRVYTVVWDVFRGVQGEGLLLVPDGKPRGDVVAIPDCEWTPEQFCGLAPGLSPMDQLARRCAEQGFRVVVPALIDRGNRFAGNPGVRSVRYSQRETLWRAAYEMGRTPLAYELQRILAVVDWMSSGVGSAAVAPGAIGVVGYGEGGLYALYAAALDPRISAAYSSGYFGPREDLWKEPIDRNVFGLLNEFGDAEVAALVAPRPLWLEAVRYPEIDLTDAHGGAPGRLARPVDAAIRHEFERRPELGIGGRVRLIVAPTNQFLGQELDPFLRRIAGSSPGTGVAAAAPRLLRPLPDVLERTARQYRQVLEDTQHLMRESEYVRREFWKRADFGSAERFARSAEWYREVFRSQVVGVIPPASLSSAPRSRWLGETNGVSRYEVVLEVHPDVFAHGILCLPADLKSGERRPVVVCQHGLEGRPSDISDPAVQSPYYHQYGLRLAERGFITFAPQNPYIGNTVFRQVLRRAQPLGLTLWSFMVRQHQVITDWLASLDGVDPDRIAFYGLSYGGKTAMRVPVWVQRYCLSICSADYNEWIWKNTSARAPYSYLWTQEYDMPEWNLGNLFNYGEMSWLIFPRPFMVERGHDDGVAPDEWVAYEFAKTRRHYVKMGLSGRTEIEFFDGPHSIHGVGSFEFLHRHLRWPPRP